MGATESSLASKSDSSGQKALQPPLAPSAPPPATAALPTLLNPTPPIPTKSAQLPPIRNLNDRLSLPLLFRLPFAITIGSLSGLILGIAKGSQDVGLRFQAENAHRLPTSQTGWYLYHKSKNYNMMFGGITEGLKQSVRFGAIVGCFFVLEEGADRGRAAGGRIWGDVVGGGYKKGAHVLQAGELDRDGEALEERGLGGSRDCLSSVLAGLGTAGLFSAWNWFPLPTAARTAKMGAKAGLAFGLVQDALSLARGRRVEYVEFVKRHTFGEQHESNTGEVLAG